MTTETKKIKLSDEARKYAEEYFYIPEKRIESGLERAMSWNGKAFGLSIRIAGLFHAFMCSENNQDPAETSISLEVMQNAANVVECLSVHAEKVFAGNDQRISDCVFLLKRLRRYMQTGRRDILKSKMWASVRGRFGSMERLNEILQLLEEHGYIKVEKQATGGRPSEHVKINPLLLNEPEM